MTTSLNTIRRSPRLGAGLVAVLALPVVMGPGKCGFILDFTETFMITDPFGSVVLGADDGSVVATEYERNGAMLKRHTFAFEPSLANSEWSVEDGVLTAEARCKYDGNCRFDHMFELPLGVGFEITMKDSQISLGYIGGDIEVTFLTGWFRGVRLLSPNTTITLDKGDVTLDYQIPPETVTVDLGEGNVIIEVPVGAYRCALIADAGAATTNGVTCDDAAAAVLDVHVKTGDIAVTGV